MSPANETVAVVFQIFYLQFLRQRAQLGRPATRTDSKASPLFRQRVPRGGPRCQNTDPSAMERREQNKQQQQPSNIHHLPSPVPHPHHHHHSPCQPPPTTFLQVLDHPHSKLGVGGQAPTPPSDLPGGWPNPVHSSQNGVWDRGPGARKVDIHKTNEHDSPRHRHRTRSRPSHTQLQPTQHPSPWNLRENCAARDRARRPARQSALRTARRTLSPKRQPTP
jgi:hypothetical protein